MPSLYIVSCMSLKKHTERVSRRLQVYRCFLIRLTGYCVRSRSKVKPLQSCRHICARSLGTLNASQGQTTSLPRDESYNLSTRTQGFHQNEHILVIFLSKCVLALYHRVITTAWCRFQAPACLMGGRAGGRLIRNTACSSMRKAPVCSVMPSSSRENTKRSGYLFKMCLHKMSIARRYAVMSCNLQAWQVLVPSC